MVGAIEAVLGALNAAGVRYLVVGGVAVVLHGRLDHGGPRSRRQLSPDNARRAVHSLATLGYRPRAPVRAEQFADAAIRESWLREKGLTVFGLWSDRYSGPEVEFVAEPFDFDAAYARAVTVTLDTITATVVSLPDLIARKRASGRPLDLADIDALQTLTEGDA
jgi:hypothetical protein